MLLYLRGANTMPNDKEMIKKLFQLIVLLAAMIAGMILMYVIALSGIMLVHACSFQEAMVYLTQAGGLRFMQALQAILVFVLPVLLMLKLFKQPLRAYLSLHQAQLKYYLAALGSILLMMPFMNMLITWNEQLHLPQALSSVEAWMRQQEASANELTQLMMSDVSVSGLLLNLLVMAIFTGFAEECLFRGTLQRMLTSDTDKMPHLAIWVTAFIFSAIHLQFYGFFPRLLMGAWFGYLLCWSGSLWVPAAAHAFNNAMVVLSHYAVAHQWIPEHFGETIGTGRTWYLALLSLLAIVLLSLYLSDKQFSLKKLFSQRH